MYSRFSAIVYRLAEMLQTPIGLLFSTLLLTAFALSGWLSVISAQILFVSATAVGAVAICNCKFLKEQRVATWCVLSIFVVCMVCLVRAAQPVLLPQYVGKLIAPPIFWSPGDKDSLVVVGNVRLRSRLKLTYPSNYHGQLFHFVNESDLRIEKYGSKILVSAQIRDERGQLVAQIVRNEWKVSPNAWDRNYNANTLEVIDSAGDVVLQISVLSDVILLQGEFWSSDSKGVRFSVGPDGWAVIELAPFKEPSPIDPIFLYPSDLHFGELAH